MSCGRVHPTHAGSGISLSARYNIAIKGDNLATSAGFIIGDPPPHAPPYCPLGADVNRAVIDEATVASSGLLEILNGTLELRSGFLAAEQVFIGNIYEGARLQFDGGTLSTFAISSQYSPNVVVGDGLHSAYLRLNSGILDVLNGVTIREHARLEGLRLSKYSLTNAGVISPGLEQPGSMQVDGDLHQLPPGIVRSTSPVEHAAGNTILCWCTAQRI